MLIHRILTMKRRNKPRARPRRSAAESRFQLESLEDRTALSVAWGAPQLAPLVSPRRGRTIGCDPPDMPRSILESTAIRLSARPRCQFPRERSLWLRECVFRRQPPNLRSKSSRRHRESAGRRVFYGR